MASWDQHRMREPPQPLVSRHVLLNQAEEDEELNGVDKGQGENWSDASSEPALLLPPNAASLRHYPAAGKRRRTNAKSWRRRRSLNPTTSSNPIASNKPFSSNDRSDILERHGPPPRPSGEIIWNTNCYQYNLPPYASPPLFGQQTSVPQAVDPPNPFSPDYNSYHAANGYKTYQPKSYPQAGPYPGDKLHHGGRLYYKDRLNPQHTYMPSIQPDPSHGHYWAPHERYWNSCSTQPTPYRSDRMVPELQHRSTKPLPSSLECKFDQLKIVVEEVQRSQQEAQREKRDRERAEKEAAGRERKTAERKAERKEESAKLLRNLIRHVKMQQRDGDLEVQGIRRDPARTRRPWLDDDAGDFSSVARQIEADLPFERPGKQHLLHEQFLQFLESRMQQNRRWSSEVREKGGDLDRLVGLRTHGHDVASRSMNGVRNDAAFRNEGQEATIDLLRRLSHKLLLSAEQLEDFNRVSTVEAPQRPRNFEAEASDLLRKMAMPADDRLQDSLPLRTSDSMQISQGPEGLEKDNKLTPNDPDRVTFSLKVDRQPTDPGYASRAARTTSRSENGQHTGSATVRKMQAIPAPDIRRSKQSKGNLRGQRDQGLPSYQGPQVDPATEESDEFDGVDIVYERKPARYALKIPEAPDPPQR
ncbi:MAG: hypothetical protein Q9165_008912, partial [Trypethelium subeluteriae]